MDFLSTMKAKAKADKKVIVLPESYEKRNLEAAAECLKEELADIILIGKKDKIMEAAGSFDVSKAIFVDPETYDRMDEMVAGLAEARKSKGMTLEEARKILMDDSLFVAVMLVKMGVADGMVSGAIHSTADTLRPALQILKTAPGTELVSSFFIMVTKTPQYGDDGILLLLGLSKGQTAHMDVKAAGPCLIAGVAQIHGSLADLLPGHLPELVVQGHGMGDDLKPLFQRAVVLAVDPLFAVIGDFQELSGIGAIFPGPIDLQLHTKEPGC